MSKSRGEKNWNGMSIGRQLDTVCDSFDEQWSEGNRPNLEEFLSRVDSSKKPTLALLLIEIDVEYRARAGEIPTLDDYVELTAKNQQDSVREIINRVAEVETVSPHDLEYDAADTVAPRVSRTSPHSKPKETFQEVGDYEILKEIARGGMGVVYKARQKRLNRIVAIKMILSGQLAGEEEITRFCSEAEAAANLDHPGIVPIFEIGQHEGHPFFSMGFVDGDSLAERIKDRPMPPSVAVELVQKIAVAIAFAHDRGVIHRDLKPANVLIDENGEPRITDFGLAKRIDDDSGLTATGQVLGTPSFMPPEQAAGDTNEINERSDVYSLGAILYNLLTGRPPFQAANPVDIILQVIEQEPVKPRKLDRAIPKDLETICLKCLEKSPAKRYPNAQFLADELQRFTSGESIVARPAGKIERSWRWCKRKPAIATSIGMAFVIVAAVLITTPWIAFLYQRQLNLNSSLQESLKREGAAKSELEESFSELSLSHANLRYQKGDVKKAVSILRSIPEPNRKLEWHLLYGDLAGSDITISSKEHAARCLSFHPSGKYFASGGSDHRINFWDSIDGSRIDSLAKHSAPIKQIAFSNNGKYMASIDLSGQLFVWDTKTRTRIFDYGSSDSKCVFIAFSPDSNALAVSVEGNRIEVLNTLDFKLNTVIQSTGVAQFSANGGTIFVAEQSRLSRFMVDGSKKSETLFSSSSVSSDSNEILLAINPNGKSLAFEVETGLGSSIYLADIGSKERQLIEAPMNSSIGTMSFCPTGTRLSFSLGNTIHVKNLAQDSELELVGHTDEIRDISFHPINNRLASVDESGTIKIWDCQTARRCVNTCIHPNEIHQLLLSENQELIATCDGQTIQIRDVRTLSLLHEIHSAKEEIWLIGFDRKCDEILYAHISERRGRGFGQVDDREFEQVNDREFEQVCIFNIANKKEREIPLNGRFALLHENDYLVENKLLLWNNRDRSAHVFDLDTRQLEDISAIENDEESTFGFMAAFVQDDRSVKIVSYNKTSGRLCIEPLRTFQESVDSQARERQTDRDSLLVTPHFLSKLRTSKGFGLRPSMMQPLKPLELFNPESSVESSERQNLIGYCNGQYVVLLDHESVDSVASFGGKFFEGVDVEFDIADDRLAIMESERIRILKKANLDEQISLESPSGTSFNEMEWCTKHGRLIVSGSDGYLTIWPIGQNSTTGNLPSPLAELKESFHTNWHADRADSAESRNDWYAALFHRSMILQANPDQAIAWDLLQDCNELAKRRDPSHLKPAITKSLLQRTRPNGSSVSFSRKRLSEFETMITELLVSAEFDRRYIRTRYCRTVLQAPEAKTTLALFEMRLGNYETAVQILRSKYSGSQHIRETRDLAIQTICYENTKNYAKAENLRKILRTKSIDKKNAPLASIIREALKLPTQGLNEEASVPKQLSEIEMMPTLWPERASFSKAAASRGGGIF